jgi:hypothetical protein
VGNLPSGPVNVIKEDPKNPDVLYVGTDLGMYMTLDGGEEWHALPGGNLPTSFFHDLVVHPREDILVAATHGRGVWALDVRPLQDMTPEVMGEPVYLFDMEAVELPMNVRGGSPSATIHYWVGEPAAQALIQIRDAGGSVVRELSGSAEQGLQRVVWNLTREGAQPARGRSMNRVGEGNYTVTVVVGSASSSSELELRR